MIRTEFDSDQDERVVIEYDDTNNAWNDWKHGNLISKFSVHERFTLSLFECTKIYNTYNTSKENFNQTEISIPALVKKPPIVDVNCHVCQKMYSYLYPCRICGKVYHQQCLKSFGENLKSFQSIKNAMQLIGWTCPICEDLRVLLTTEELMETNNWIKSLGVQKLMNLDQYINIRLKTESFLNFNEFPTQMKTILQNFLNTIADTSSLRMNEEDLFLLDISLKILCIPSKLLVNSLTQFELYDLSQLFLFLSSNDHQHITYKKFHQIFHTYFLSNMPEVNSNEKHLHLEALAYSFLGNIIRSDRTWSRFLLDMTIPTILGRLNHRLPSDFVNRLVPIKRSTNSSPPTKNLQDKQTLSSLMRNIYQKLTQTDEHEKKRTRPIDQRKMNK